MKTVQVPKPVRDVNGLLQQFHQADPPFGIVSLGTDPRTTYVYLDDSEMRNPIPIVEAWVDVPELKASSSGSAGRDGIGEASSNGVDVHTVLIQKVNPSGNVLEGTEKLSVTAPPGVIISDVSPKLSDGMAMVQIGPSSLAGDFTVEVRDRSGKMKPVKLPLRFVKQKVELQKVELQTDQQQESAPSIEKKGGIMATIRRILGI